MSPRIFHVSEEPGIEWFEPRLGQAFPEEGPLVFAIAETHLRNYLVPRNCPRVTYGATKTCKKADVDRYLEGDWARKVLAIEKDWLERAKVVSLFQYEFDSDLFLCLDAGAGTYVARETVAPKRVACIERPLEVLKGQGVKVRTLESLWPLHDEITQSSSQFSMIRMRNAKPRV